MPCASKAQLPHHRAYGSVPRRFGGLSARQLFHGKHSQRAEASFGDDAMQSFREAQPPGSVAGEARSSRLAATLKRRNPGRGYRGFAARTIRIGEIRRG
jgi:hypothetical protein